MQHCGYIHFTDHAVIIAVFGRMYVVIAMIIDYGVVLGRKGIVELLY